MRDFFPELLKHMEFGKKEKRKIIQTARLMIEVDWVSCKDWLGDIRQ